MTDPHDDVQHAQSPAREGLPLWIPLAGLLVAMIVAVIVGVRVFPVLAALLFPPEPPLPPVDVRLIGTPENKGVGRDEWLFGTNGNACELMRYYQDRLGGCEEDPSISCATTSGHAKPSKRSEPTAFHGRYALLPITKMAPSPNSASRGRLLTSGGQGTHAA